MEANNIYIIDIDIKSCYAAIDMSILHIAPILDFPFLHVAHKFGT